jgi:hypothetical protein
VFARWEGGIMSKARSAIPTVTFVDEYCRLYQDLFPAVRSAGTLQVFTRRDAVRHQTQDVAS